MGTQQIFMIVVSVIIIGIAIAVGITMLNDHAFLSNRRALAAELQDYSTLAIQYYKAPVSMGGAGGDASKVTLNSVAAFMAFNWNSTKLAAVGYYSASSSNGETRILEVNGQNVILKGLGKEEKRSKFPAVTLTLDLENNTIATNLSSSTSF